MENALDFSVVQDPLEFFSHWETFTDREHLEGPGILVEDGGEDGDVAIFIVEDYAAESYGEIVVSKAPEGWFIEKIGDVDVTPLLNMVPPDWHVGLVVEHREFITWIDLKANELENVSAEQPGEKEAFLGLQSLPDGQDSTNYQRSGLPSGGGSTYFPKDEHMENWDPDVEFDRFYKERP